MNGVSTQVRNYKLKVVTNGKYEEIPVTEAMAREAVIWKNKGKSPTTGVNYREISLFDLHDDDGNYTGSIERGDFKGPKAPQAITDGIMQKGYYCEWGLFHRTMGDPCDCWMRTGVAPQTMVRLRKEMFPNWADGLFGRPPKGYAGNAMTRTMQREIIARAKQEMQMLDQF